MEETETRISNLCKASETGKKSSPYQDAVQIIENISGNKTSFLTAQ